MERTAALRIKLIIADQKLHALRAFMAEARTHEGEMLDCLMEQPQKGDSPETSMSLHVMQDGTVGFLDL